MKYVIGTGAIILSVLSIMGIGWASLSLAIYVIFCIVLAWLAGMD